MITVRCLCCVQHVFVPFCISVDQENPSCVDITGTTQIAPFGSQSIPVVFQEPQATDNSNTVMIVSRDRTPGSNFPIGTTSVCYMFEDPSSNRATCCVDVTVIGASEYFIWPDFLLTITPWSHKNVCNYLIVIEFVSCII